MVNELGMLRDLRSILIGCYKDKGHPVTYVMDEKTREAKLTTRDGPLLDGKSISIEDMFACLHIIDVADLPDEPETETTLMLYDKLTDGVSELVYEIISTKGICLGLFYRDSNGFGHLVHDPVHTQSAMNFQPGYTLEKLNNYWDGVAVNWEVIPKEDPNTNF